MDARILLRLNEMAATLNEIKLENASLRKAILGSENLPCSSSSLQSRDLLGNNSLLEIVVETRNRVKAIDKKMMDNKEEQEEVVEIILPQRGVKRRALEAIPLNHSDSSEESTEENPIGQIPRPLENQRKRTKENFKELIKSKTADDGKSLVGTTAQLISDSIPFYDGVKSSITLKLSNFLDSNLTDPQYFNKGLSTGGPSKVCGNFSEVFTFTGKEDTWGILCSFAVRSLLRLTICSVNHRLNGICLGIGFTPADATLDYSFIKKLIAMPPAPEFCINFKADKEPVELFISSGDLLARAHGTFGSRSIIHVEILEIGDD